MPGKKNKSSTDAAKRELTAKRKAIKARERQSNQDRTERQSRYLKETGFFDPTTYKNTGFGSSVEKKKSMATGKPKAYRYGGKK